MDRQIATVGRADDTRRRLLAAGRLAFAERGHDGVRLQRDVLEPSGVSNGSFYHQFTDKTDLLVAVLDDAAEAGRFVVAESISGDSEGDPVDRARRAFQVWLALVDGAEDLFRIQLRERQNPDPRVRDRIQQLRQRWVDTIADAVRAQGRSLPADLDLAASLIASLTYGVLVDYLDTPRSQRAPLRAKLLDVLPRFVVGGAAGLDPLGAASQVDDQ